MLISFAKYHALGNSFIVLDQVYSRGRAASFGRLAVAMCDPRRGIGADGLMVVSQQGGSFRLDVYNADGSWAEKSGNGTRIAAMHLYNRGLLSGKKCDLRTGSGTSRVTFHSGSDRRRIISASLGSPRFETAAIPIRSRDKYFINQPLSCAGRTYVASAVSIGNPHLILFCDNFDFDWPAVGARLESDPLFPNRINVGFVVVRGKADLEIRDWERGAGPTASSGTGAAAAAAVSVVRGFTAREVNVHTSAGTLGVVWDDSSDELIIRGPVISICSGEFRKVQR